MTDFAFVFGSGVNYSHFSILAENIYIMHKKKILYCSIFQDDFKMVTQK